MEEQRYRQAEQQLWASVGVIPTERFVPLAGTGTHVRVQEVGAGDPVLFVHGAPNAGATFAPLVEHLPGRRLLLVDRPGCGLSTPAPVDAVTLPAFGDRFVLDVLDGLGIERADVVASSLGGYLALRAAATAPDRFRSMVQLGCPAFVPGMRMPAMIRMIASPLRHLITRLPASERAGRATLVQLGHRASVEADRLPPALAPWFVALQDHTDTYRHDGQLIAHCAGPVRGFDRSLQLDPGTLAAIAVPTLLVWGADDAFGGPAVGEDLRDALPDADLVVQPASGHLPWFDDGPGVADLIDRHLAAHPTPAP